MKHSFALVLRVVSRGGDASAVDPGWLWLLAVCDEGVPFMDCRGCCYLLTSLLTLIELLVQLNLLFQSFFGRLVLYGKRKD